MSGLLAPSSGASYTPAADGPPPAEEPTRAPDARRRGRAPRAESAGADATGEAGADGAGRRPRWARARRVAGALGVVGALGAIATAGAWGPRALSHLAFFRVRRVEIDGARYAVPSELVARLGVDTAASVWTDLGALGRRVATHPMVDAARVERRLPGVLRVVVHERVPVAQVAAGPRGALLVYDATGAALPIEPARVGGVDVPLAASADPALLRVLGALRDGAPRAYARVLEAARAPRAAAAPPDAELPNREAPNDAARGEHDEVDLVLGPAAGAAPGASAGPPVLVRAAVDVSAGRFADLGPVEDDLARRGVHPAELDLRFRDQVVARLAGPPPSAAAAVGPALSAPAAVAAAARPSPRPAVPATAPHASSAPPRATPPARRAARPASGARPGARAPARPRPHPPGAARPAAPRPHSARPPRSPHV